ncbi:hypothetical protein Rhal01_03194 [Rubritalea halochordaticola]|uniref:Band 7 domain-containing protein n=1 Tax=Rubritalea halochordaticola TaxID=714537 RepID=A0ABP9V2W9_9BACT
MQDHQPNSRGAGKLIGFGIISVLFIVLILALNPFATVPAGHVGVTTLFGKVDGDALPEGFHVINPLKKVTTIDCREKELTLQDVGVPSQDQLTTDVDVTVKWRVDKTTAAHAYQETGDASDLERVHLVPKLRSLIREAGKSVNKAESFYQSEVQVSMQKEILDGLQKLTDKGLLVDEILIRKVDLPPTIIEGVLSKKRREQAAEQQIAELNRYQTEQKQKIAQAEAEKQAALQEAEKRRALADAKAYEILKEAEARAQAIKLEGEALSQNSELLRLRAIERWSGVMPKVMLGEGGVMPLIDLKDIDKN